MKMWFLLFLIVRTSILGVLKIIKCFLDIVQMLHKFDLLEYSAVWSLRFLIEKKKDNTDPSYSLNNNRHIVSRGSKEIDDRVKKSSQKNTWHYPQSHHTSRPFWEDKRSKATMSTIINPTHSRKRSERIPECYYGCKEHMSEKSERKNVPGKSLCAEVFNGRKTCSNEHTCIEDMPSGGWFQEEYC